MPEMIDLQFIYRTTTSTAIAFAVAFSFDAAGVAARGVFYKSVNGLHYFTETRQREVNDSFTHNYERTLETCAQCMYTAMGVTIHDSESKRGIVWKKQLNENVHKYSRLVEM